MYEIYYTNLLTGEDDSAFGDNTFFLRMLTCDTIKVWWVAPAE